MVRHGGNSAGSYLADPTSPIPSHCASIVATSTLRVNAQLQMVHMRVVLILPLLPPCALHPLCMLMMSPRYLLWSLKAGMQMSGSRWLFFCPYVKQSVPENTYMDYSVQMLLLLYCCPDCPSSWPIWKALVEQLGQSWAILAGIKKYSLSIQKLVSSVQLLCTLRSLCIAQLCCFSLSPVASSNLLLGVREMYAFNRLFLLISSKVLQKISSARRQKGLLLTLLSI